jgi:8-oxo-dGTP pyrophosphatase MutT (NUDIX family)
MEAAQRELREELRVLVTRVDEESVGIDDLGSDFRIEFTTAEIAGEPEAVEHTRVEWVPADGVLNYDLAPADRIFVEQYLRSQAP